MTATLEPITLTVPARAAAVAWINAFLAASQDEARRVLYRTLSLEFFEGGMQCIGCDGTALFRTWVPTEEGTPWPADDEAPVRSVVVMDVEKFGHVFMRQLLAVTSDDAHAFEPLVLTLMPMDDAATLALDETFLSERLVLRACGQRTDLRLFEDAYPDWRALRLDSEAVERVDGMSLATRLLALVGKLKDVAAVELEFYGETKHIAFRAGGIDTDDDTVRGLIMPRRRLIAQAEAKPAGKSATQMEAPGLTTAGA